MDKVSFSWVGVNISMFADFQTYFVMLYCQSVSKLTISYIFIKCSQCFYISCIRWKVNLLVFILEGLAGGGSIGFIARLKLNLDNFIQCLENLPNADNTCKSVGL